MCGYAASATQECLLDHMDLHITLCKSQPFLGCPWLAGALLTNQKKEESGVCPFITGKVFHCLASRIFCSAVHSHLVDCLIPYS